MDLYQTATALESGGDIGGKKMGVASRDIDIKIFLCQIAVESSDKVVELLDFVEQKIKSFALIGLRLDIGPEFLGIDQLGIAFLGNLCRLLREERVQFIDVLVKIEGKLDDVCLFYPFL